MCTEICIYMYVCKWMHVHMCTFPSCLIIHQFSAAGSRQRFMACGCAMSGFIRAVERKLTTATKHRYCVYLISMRTHQNERQREEYREKRKEKEGQVRKEMLVEVSLRDHGSLVVFPIFIAWSTGPTLSRSLQLICNPCKKMRVYWFSLRHGCF